MFIKYCARGAGGRERCQGANAAAVGFARRGAARSVRAARHAAARAGAPQRCSRLPARSRAPSQAAPRTPCCGAAAKGRRVKTRAPALLRACAPRRAAAATQRTPATAAPSRKRCRAVAKAQRKPRHKAQGHAQHGRLGRHVGDVLVAQLAPLHRVLHQRALDEVTQKLLEERHSVGRGVDFEVGPPAAPLARL